MAEAQLDVTIASEEVRMGDPVNSRVSINIRNSTGTDATCTFYLVIPTAFVPAAKTNNIVFQGLEPNPESQAPDKTAWQVGARRGTSIKSGGTATLTLSNLAAVAPGPQTIEVTWRKGNAVAGSASLTVTVLAANDSPKIFSFDAEPCVLVWRPGEKSPVTLEWETDNDSVVELRRLGTKLLPEAGRNSAPPKGQWQDKDYSSSGIQPYQLTATARGNTVSRWLFVRVQDPGWNRIEVSQGAPTLLVSDGDNQLYGMFLRDGEANVYQLATEQGALGREDKFLCKVPEGMETSPGAFFQNRIWLVGGSQIDPAVCSNDLWWFDPVKQNSGALEAAPWTPRMGHACTVFDSKLWVLGGADENGNTLNEVWCCDGTEWTKSVSLPAPRCLLTAFGFSDRLWIYGGVDAPFGTPQNSLWYLATQASHWRPMTFRGGIHQPARPDPHFGDPFGSALCVDTSQDEAVLCGLVTFQGEDGIASAMFELSGYAGMDEADLSQVHPIASGKGWPTKRNAAALQQPFRLSAVAFKSLIFVVSLVYGADNRSLTYLVQ